MHAHTNARTYARIDVPGIMQSPFVNELFPLGWNFGSLGVLMGHEITHGFDDQGRQFDEYARLKVAKMCWAIVGRAGRVGHGGPWWAGAGRGGPWRGMTGSGRLRRAVAGHGGLWGAVAGRGGLWQAVAGRAVLWWAVAGHAVLWLAVAGHAWR